MANVLVWIAYLSETLLIREKGMIVSGLNRRARMGLRPACRTVAVALLLATLLFTGAQLARSAVRSLAAPLAGLERLAQRPPAPEPAPPPLPSSEDLGLILPAPEEPAADPHNPAKATLKIDTARQLAMTAKRQLAYREVFQTLDGHAISVELVNYFGRTSDLSLEGLPQLTKDLALTDLQRERIERWLAWKKESLAALGEQKNPQAIRDIEEATAEAVRAELDFFQGELFDKRRHEASHQTASIRLVAAEALNVVHLQPQGAQTRTRWATLTLKNAEK